MNPLEQKDLLGRIFFFLSDYALVRSVNKFFRYIWDVHNNLPKMIVLHAHYLQIPTLSPLLPKEAKYASLYIRLDIPDQTLMENIKPLVRVNSTPNLFEVIINNNAYNFFTEYIKIFFSYRSSQQARDLAKGVFMSVAMRHWPLEKKITGLRIVANYLIEAPITENILLIIRNDDDKSFKAFLDRSKIYKGIGLIGTLLVIYGAKKCFSVLDNMIQGARYDLFFTLTPSVPKQLGRSFAYPNVYTPIVEFINITSK